MITPCHFFVIIFYSIERELEIIPSTQIFIYLFIIRFCLTYSFTGIFKMETQQLLIVLCGSVVLFFAYLTNFLLLHPRKLRSKLQSQGIKGPSSPSFFLHGNIKKQAIPEENNNQELEQNKHTWPFRVFSHIKQWQIEYGQILIFIIQITFNSFSLCGVCSFFMFKLLQDQYSCTHLELHRYYV